MDASMDTDRPVVTYKKVSLELADRAAVRHLDLTGLDTSQVTDMDRMFFRCKNLESLDLTGFDTSHVTTMRGMFAHCEKLAQVDLSGLDTSQVVRMSCMFEGCKSLEILDLSGLDASNVRWTKAMFRGCTKLKQWTVSDTWPVRLYEAIPEPKPSGGWWSEREGRLMTTEEIRARGPVADTFILKWPAVVSASNWQASKAIPSASTVTRIDLEDLDTSMITDMSGMFGDCWQLKSLDLSHFSTSQVTDMRWMFQGCKNLVSIDLSGFDTSQVTEMLCMFKGCAGLERWTVPATWPIKLEGAIPDPTNKSGTWWSERDGRWMTSSQIRERGPVADTFTSTKPSSRT